MEESGRGAKLHVVMVPWLAFGHIIPFLELSKSLAKRGHKVSFISTPRNIQRMPRIPHDISNLIELVGLPLPPVDGLPATAEATIDISQAEMDYLKIAADGLAGPLSAFIGENSPDWVICDFFCSWLPSLVAERGARCVFFSIFTAAMLAYLGPPIDYGERWKSPKDLLSPGPWIPFPTLVSFRLHEARLLYEQTRTNASGLSDTSRFFSVIQGVHAVFVKSCTELESEWLELLNNMYDKPVLPAGLLPPSQAEAGGGDGGRAEATWLDKQSPGSTVYVALGSELRLAHHDLTELALGLELSGLPFLWALREGSNDLPSGFEDRINGRGIVCKGWVPQLRIMAHPATGGFLTHCGMSSVIEALGHGMALVRMPMMIDQGLNSRSLEEKGIGLEIPRDDRDGSLTREGVAKTLRLVMVEEAGQPIRAKSWEVKDIFSNKDLHEGYVDKLVHFLQEQCHG